MDIPQNAKVGIAIGCMALAGGIMYFTMFSGSGGGDSGDYTYTLLCGKCGKNADFKQEEFTKMAQSSGQMMDPMMGMSGPFPCKFCNQKAMFLATKCPKCKFVFVNNPMMTMQSRDYPDRCPKCKFSQVEQDMKSQK